MLVPDRTQDMKKRTGALPYILRGIPLYYSTVASRVELRPTADLPTRHSERPLIVVCCLCARASANCSQPAGPTYCQLGPHGPGRLTGQCRPALTPCTDKLLRNKIRAEPHAANSSNRREQTVKRVTSHDFFFEKTRQNI
jgi:hypothetical protein